MDMDIQTPEMKVADAGEKYFKQLRLTSKDPRVSMEAAKWEIFFDDRVKELKKTDGRQLEMRSIIEDHHEEEPTRHAQGGSR